MPAGSTKFFGPLSLAKVLLIFLITNVAMQLLCVALREGLGFNWATAAGAGAAGGFLGVVVVSALVRKNQAAAVTDS